MNTPMRKSSKRHPWLAALLSLLMPGLGQFYCGAIIRCLGLLALTNAAGMLVVLALVGVRGVHPGGDHVALAVDEDDGRYHEQVSFISGFEEARRDDLIRVNVIDR